MPTIITYTPSPTDLPDAGDDSAQDTPSPQHTASVFEMDAERVIVVLGRMLLWIWH
jgi:hypothetical protein